LYTNLKPEPNVIKQVNSVAEFDDSFTGSERMFVFIFISLQLTFYFEGKLDLAQ